MLSKSLVLMLQLSYIFCNTDIQKAPSLSLNPNPVIVNDATFINLGTYRGFTDVGAEYQKSYFVSRFMKAPFGESRAICRSYDLELVTLETLNETLAFLKMADNCKILQSLEILVDGATSSPHLKGDWLWTKTGAKISFPLPWDADQPNAFNNVQFCLSIYKENMTKNFGFNDAFCTNPFLFACQRIELFIPKVADTV
ncbi:hypothetical protein ACKWTF_008875 [Chironomus riparius]